MRKALAVLVLIALALGSAYYVLSLPEVPPAKTDIVSSYRLAYVLSAYGIEELGSVSGEPPPSANLSGVPAISYEKSYCATTCLQMVAAYYGINKSIHYLNFITGFTYGATLFRYGNETFFLPYSDPFVGLKNASGYLGLRYRFLVTNDGEEFIKAIKTFIASGTPVIVPVNAARLYSFKGFAPHFELVVGYEGDEFILHEPVKRGPGAPSIVRFGASLLARANEDLMKTYGMLWSHGFAVYEPGGDVVRGLADALRSVGRLEKGFVFDAGNVTIATGSYALEKLADAVEKGEIDPNYLSIIMKMAQQTRADDARFIGENFLCCLKTAAASNLLWNASRTYGEVLRLLSNPGDDWAEKAAALIRSAAQKERIVGALLIDASYSCVAG